MEIKARMPGKVEVINVKVGDIVKEGEVVLIMEALKMKTPIASPVAGTVKSIDVAIDDRVNAGQLLIVVD